MNKSCLAILSGLAFGGALIVNAPHVWSQAGQPGTGAAPSAGQKSGSESQVQKPTDPPVSSSQKSGSSGISRSEGTGMQAGTESRGAGKWSKDKVKAIQEALKTKGFDPGAADGVVGPKTGQALRDFQKSQNLQVTGRIDDKTASALGVDSGGMSSSQPSSKESTIGSRGAGTSSQPSGSMEKEKTGSPVSEPDKPGARGGTTTSPPSKPTGKE